MQLLIYFLIVLSLLVLKIFCQIIGICKGSEPAPFFVNLFIYFYESKGINEIKNKDLIKARKLCNIFRFIDDINSINDDEKLETDYFNIYLEELEPGKGNTDQKETSVLDSHIKIRNGKF